MSPLHEPADETLSGPAASAADPVLPAALDRLVQRAVLTRMQADAVLAEVVGGPGAALPARRRIFAEIAGYLGAAFVVGATVLYLGQEWAGFTRGGRFTILAAMAVLLAVSGVVAGRRGGRPQDDVRRRLASTLLTGAAGAAAFAAYVILQPDSYLYSSLAEDRATWAAAVTALVVAVLGYLFARSAVGQLGVAVAGCAVLGSSLELARVYETSVLGVGIVLLGVLWVVLVRRRLLAERRLALAVAVTFGVTGAQTVVLQDADSARYLGYALTALVAAACFAGYARLRDWILLAGGVVGATLVVPEFLYDVTDESFGPSGVMLAAGLTLLAAGLVGLRIRQTSTPGAPTADALK